MRVRLAAALLALAAVTGCVVEPPGGQLTEDLQSDFETEDYFNP